MDFPAVGDIDHVIPNHFTPQVNLHDELHIIDGGEVMEVLPIAARGRVR